MVFTISVCGCSRGVLSIIQGCAEGGFQGFQETPTEIVSSKKSSDQCVAD